MLRVLTLLIFGHIVTLSVSTHTLPVASDSILNSSSRFQRSHRLTRDVGYVYSPEIGSHKIHSVAATWSEALLICKVELAHLAIINSQAESQAIARLFEKSYPHVGSANSSLAFIGFHDQFREGLYITIHDETLAEAGFEQWFHNQPDNAFNGENCGAIVKNGQLNDVSCSDRYAFVCERPDLMQTAEQFPGIISTGFTPELEIGDETTAGHQKHIGSSDVTTEPGVNFNSTSTSGTESFGSLSIESTSEIPLSNETSITLSSVLSEFVDSEKSVKSIEDNNSDDDDFVPDDEKENYTPADVIKATTAKPQVNRFINESSTTESGIASGAPLTTKDEKFEKSDKENYNDPNTFPVPDRAMTTVTPQQREASTDATSPFGVTTNSTSLAREAESCHPDESSTTGIDDLDSLESHCSETPFGCCPDNVTAAEGNNYEGCPAIPCNESKFGCCPGEKTPAVGKDNLGCCNVTTHGCCPNGVSVAKGPQEQGCGCENTEFKCCSDGITPAKGENYAGCTCDASKYGCCPDGVEEAQGDNFEGCLTVISRPGAACALERDRGSCSDFTVRWFFDTEYGGCSTFLYGGCEGNENRFKSEDECTDICVEPKGRDACFLPKSSGPCKEHHSTWYFDTDRKQCGQFTYKGCLGNANKFKTRDECEELCVIPDGIGELQNYHHNETSTTESSITSGSPLTTKDETLQKSDKENYNDPNTFPAPDRAMTTVTPQQKEASTDATSTFGVTTNSTSLAREAESRYPDESSTTGIDNLDSLQSDCSETPFGCCPDNVTAAEGNNYEGCLAIPCNESKFGCCPGQKTPALGKDNLGCCNVTTHGCCPDGFKPASGPDAEGCDEKETSTITTPGYKIEITTSAVEATTASKAGVTNTSQVAVTTVSEDEEGCANSEFGCCPDQESPAAGTNFEGCGVTTTELPIEQHMACRNSTFSCCDDGTTPAHGPNKEGCCLATPYGCCPDNIQHAQGPDLYGCDCQYSRYGCCPGNTTSARGSNNEGCACEHTPHGCCPNRIATASGPDFEGCACHTYQFGCCPDGVSVAKGPQAQGCGCENTEFKCCSDGITPAKGENYAGCTCDASKYGCCPDGVEEAQGDNFEGCLTVISRPGAACALERDCGSCSDFTVRWFFDTEYGGCSTFLYGGCEGNENRFKSQDECKDVCVEPKGRDACYLPKISGPCEEYHPTWYFDTERKQCGQFIYKGCLGNANKFKTREACEELCVIPDDIDACEQSKEVGPCEGNFTRWYFNKESDSCEEFAYGGCKANKNNFPTQISCRQQCLTSGRSRGSCSLPREEGSCTEKHARWSFDQSENRCMPFFYTGCGGNRNNYETRDACDSDCPPKIEQDTCLLPALLGECYNYTQRWYYDSYESRCRQFYYGSCGGNGNNFATENDCTHRCQPAAITPPPEVPQFRTADNVVDVGPKPGREDPCSAARAECETIRCPYGTEDYVDERNCQHCRCVDPCRTEICQEGTKCAVTLVSVGGSVAYRSVCRSILKPGNCPEVSNTTSCQTECSSDADCDSDLKCCANGCGSSCLQPAPEEPLTTPPPRYVVTVPYPDAIAATIEEPIEPNVSAEEGSYVVLKCPCHGNPRPSITWRKNVTLIDNSVSRHSISVDGSLQIVDLYRSDAGTYTCTADNRLAAPGRIQYVLTITAPHKHTASILGAPNHRVTVTLNSETILRCNVVGWPRPMVSWWLGNAMLPFSNTVYEQHRDHSLRIHNVSLVNLGNYTCQAYNGIGQPATWSVILQALGPVYNLSPENQKYAKYLVEPEKSPVKFSTVKPPFQNRTQTTKAPQIQPYEPSYPDTAHINISATASTIEPFPELLPRKYSVPVKVNVSADEGPFPEGSEFSIVCNVNGFPLPRVEWFKDDNPIRIDNRITISAANKLIITDSEMSDSGRYRCQAANEFTSDADTLDITVAGIYIHPNCQDVSFFSRCDLIVKGNFCKHQYYARFCCRSCTEAGQLPALGPHIPEK